MTDERIAIIAAERTATGAQLVSIDERGDRRLELLQHPATRVRDNQRLMVFLALTALAFAVVFGFVSRGHSAPPPATLPTVAAAPNPVGRQIDAVLKALKPVDVVVVSDGEHHRYSLSRGETRTFMAEMALKLEVMDGGAVHLRVNGVDMGVPGFDGVPWRHSYSFDTTSNSASSGG